MIVCANFLTVVVEVAANPPSDVRAVIVAEPSPTAVTSPAALTVATCTLDEDQVTALFVALDGRTAAVSVCVRPGARATVVGDTVTPVAGTVDVTVTAVEAVSPPSVVVTVIVAAPAATAVTTPLVLTDAIDVFDDAHVTAGVVAVLGATTAVSAWVWPRFKVTEVGETVTPVTGTVVEPPLSKAPALTMPTPHVLTGSGSQTPPGKGVNIPDVFIRVSTCAGVNEGFCEIMSATTPETWGVAMLVPLYEAYEGVLGVVEPLFRVDQMPTPGAAMSTMAP